MAVVKGKGHPRAQGDRMTDIRQLSTNGSPPASIFRPIRIRQQASLAGQRPVPSLSLVIPTRNESNNIEPLVSRLQKALGDIEAEIIFVDDSDDDTPQQVKFLSQRTAMPVRIIHRESAERAGGLGGAVVEGLRAARGSWVCVMDADLQHPPELVPELLQKAQSTDAEIVIGSRRTEGGTAEGGFNIARAGLSAGSTLVAKRLFPKSLSQVSDPMSGFFLVKKSSLQVDELNPSGFKILLEILVRTPKLRIAEVGFSFGQRLSGESKASAQEGIRYLMLVSNLRFGRDVARLVRFGTVGMTGLAINLILVALFTEIVGIYYLASAVLATQGSTLWNYVLTNRWVYADRVSQRRSLSKIGLFYSMNNAALLLRGPLIFIFTSMFAVNYLVSTALSLVILMFLRFALSDSLIWNGQNSMSKHAKLYSYNVHDLTTVESEVRLPELEPFMVAVLDQSPDIRVRIGGNGSKHPVQTSTDSRLTSFVYHDGIGPLGFQIEAAIGETIDIQASRLLRRSPHVLYTNVVEPILRWTFVDKGYALVHGAAIAVDEDAYLITALTDTGKTTTTLRLLDRQRRASDRMQFLSDDLTLVGPDGTILNYPKPMTISNHTVAAVRTPLLSRRERLTLPLQSRVHSREGRRLALLLAKTRLPMATINTIVQMLIPPPKYHVDRLVPSAKSASKAKLAGMFIIERSADNNSILTSDETLEVLMRNSEDAYGFPPYDEIRSFLFNMRGTDLRAAERKIVSSALGDIRARRMCSSTLGWAEAILPAVYRDFSDRSEARTAMNFGELSGSMVSSAD